MHQQLDGVLGWMQHAGHYSYGVRLASLLLRVVPQRSTRMWCVLIRRRAFCKYLLNNRGSFVDDITLVEHAALQHGLHDERATCFGLLALYADQVEDDPRLALRNVRHAIRIALRYSTGRLDRLYISEGAFLRKIGRYREAEDALAQAWEHCTDQRVRINIQLQQAALLHAQGRFVHAEQLLGVAWHDVVPTHFVNERGDVLRERARLYRALDKPNAARQCAAEAVELFQRLGMTDKAKKLASEMADILTSGS